MTPLPIIERFSIVAPLGVCFHDTATGERVFDGLNVEVYPQNMNAFKNKTTIHPNRFGVYALQKIKGLEDFSRGSGDDKFWKENPPQKPYFLEVSDTLGRFQPFQITIELPVKGIYKWENLPFVSPNKNLESIPLYSAPTRKISGGMSVIRAQLKEVGGKSASFAVLEARFNGGLIARGIADRDGQIVMIFPLLAPQSNPIVSPPGNSTRITLAEQIWNIDLTVKYQPSIFQASPSIETENGEEKLPDLKLVLAQAEGTLWSDDGQTEEFTTAVLKTGRELILRSRENANVSPPDSETVISSFLFVSPAV